MISITEQLEQINARQKKEETFFKPVFYRLQEKTDLNAFATLLQTTGITINDHIKDQISEYVKFKNPTRKFNPEELDAQTLKHIGNTPLHEYGVWVYYPWSKRLVHILDETEFIEVRTSRNFYKITPEERDILSKKKIGVIGLSVGQSVSVTLAMERICGELRLADFDLLELTNLNRIRTGIHNLGLEKVYSVAREIAEIDPFIKVVCFKEGLTEENMDGFFTNDGKLDLLVEESDGFDIKILCRYKARELKVPVIMEASDRCMVDVERFDLEPTRSILHGIVDHLDVATLKSLKTNEEKIPYMLDVLGLETTTPRLRASMLEMQQTINTWPQLASAVTMGGGITADVSRRMLLNHFTQSGRYYVDIDELIGNKTHSEANALNINPIHGNMTLTAEKMKKIALQVKKTNSDIEEFAVKKIVEAALVAPSHANQQPWKWLLLEKQLFLFHNETLPTLFTDPKKINSFLSLGAGLENAILKAGELGYKLHYQLFPLASEKNLIASCYFTKQTEPSSGNLSAYIHKRHTNRKAGSGQEIAKDSLEEMTQLSKEFKGLSLSFITNHQNIDRISQLVGICERIRLLHPQAHHDYFTKELKWKSTANEPILEGIDIATLSVPPGVETALKVISHPSVANLLSNWEKGIAFEKFQYNITSTSSAIGLISQEGSRTESYIESGRAMEKIWLSANKNNLAFQPICLPLTFLNYMGEENDGGIFSDKIFFQIKAIKDQLSLIFSELNNNTTEAVFLFRLFEAEKPLVQSLRKPLNDIYFKG